MDIHNHNLNIHYSAPQWVWDKLNILYREMPRWNGMVDGCPLWYGSGGELIEASVEPSGLQFFARLPEEEWDSWFLLFKTRASKLLGYEIGEPEDCFDFYYWDGRTGK